MKTIDRTRFHRLNQWPHSSIVKLFGKLSSPNIDLEEKIYIKIPKKDELMYKNNLFSKKKPRMVKGDLEMPFEVNMKNYDQSEFFRIRVTAKEDFGTVDWKTGELLDPSADPIQFPAAIVFIHGGGFIGGSSGTYRQVVRKFAVQTGYPVFSVDYRLAPAFKYPTQASDSWIAYLWIKFYAERYLG